MQTGRRPEAGSGTAVAAIYIRRRDAVAVDAEDRD